MRNPPPPLDQPNQTLSFEKYLDYEHKHKLLIITSQKLRKTAICQGCKWNLAFYCVESIKKTLYPVCTRLDCISRLLSFC